MPPIDSNECYGDIWIAKVCNEHVPANENVLRRLDDAQSIEKEDKPGEPSFAAVNISKAEETGRLGEEDSCISGRGSATAHQAWRGE